MGTASNPLRRALLPFLVAAVPFALLVLRFNWLCDDAFISFRFAQNLAHGLGLVYNPGLAPVEGYSNFLWVLWLALFELFELDVTVAARLSSALAAFVLLFLLARVLRREFDARHTALALLFPATLTPLAIWATSGLATLPFALALFLLLERLTTPAAEGGPRVIGAALAAIAAVLIRADGPLFTALLLAGLLLWSARRGERGLLRATLVAGLAAGVALAAQLLWRHGYYGVWSPNTARVKVELDALTFERGLCYLGAFLLAFPSCIAALALAARRRGARHHVEPGPLTSTCLAVVLGAGAYSVLVGGDFMTSGRFLVPALPFVALLFGRSAPGPLAAGLVVALSLPAAFNVQLAPEALRTRLHFRWSSEYRTEFEQWERMRDQAREWSLLGRALAAHTQPGESLIHGTIGAVGYYSGLVIHDPFGLVNREQFREHEVPRRRSPGHHRRIPFATFMALDPTYLEADLAPAAKPLVGLPNWLRPGSEFGDQARPVGLPLGDLEGAPEGLVLRLVRRQRL